MAVKLLALRAGHTLHLLVLISVRGLSVSGEQSGELLNEITFQFCEHETSHKLQSLELVLLLSKSSCNDNSF
jgi:hypothetical protein